MTLNSWLRGLSIAGLVIVGLGLAGNVNDPQSMGYTVLLGVVWAPQCIIALILTPKS